MSHMINYSVFHPVINQILGFRECAMLVNIANKTNTKIELSANGKKGSTDSIISLVQLGIKENSGVVFTITGSNQIECCHLVMDIIKNGWQKENNDLINSEKKTDLVSVDDVISLHINLNNLILNNIDNWNFDLNDPIKYAC